MEWRFRKHALSQNLSPPTKMARSIPNPSHFERKGSKISYPALKFVFLVNFQSKVTEKRRWKRPGESSVTVLTTRCRSDGHGGSGGEGSFKNVAATALNSYFCD